MNVISTNRNYIGTAFEELQSEMCHRDGTIIHLQEEVEFPEDARSIYGQCKEGDRDAIIMTEDS